MAWKCRQKLGVTYPLCDGYEVQRTGVLDDDDENSEVAYWETAQAICVSRHRAYVEMLRDRGIIGPETPVVEHATRSDVAGRVVVGTLPLHLAAYAALVIDVPLAVPQGVRGQEMTATQLAQYAGCPTAYTVVMPGDLQPACDEGDE